MNLAVMLDIDTLREMKREGYTREQTHPTEPLAILNYTEKAVFSRTWNHVTRACRGLIYNTDTYEVVARPFPKFFNYGEEDAAVIDLSETVTVTDKMDGSLGIQYWQPNAKSWAIATRGSFTSDQALHATAKLQSTLQGDWAEYYEHWYTNLFEIVYPENRIVLDYGQLDNLVYIGCVNIEDGGVISADVVDRYWTDAQGLGCTRLFGEMTFADALSMEPRPNAEGIVIISADGKRMLKVKQEDYVRLHRIISGLSVKSVWQMIRDSKSRDEIKYDLPEEFWPWIDETYNEIDAQFRAVFHGAHITHRQLRDQIIKGPEDRQSRKEYAQLAQKFPYKGLLFQMLDNRDVNDVVFKMIEPKGEQNRPFARGEDVA